VTFGPIEKQPGWLLLVPSWIQVVSARYFSIGVSQETMCEVTSVRSIRPSQNVQFDGSNRQRLEKSRHGSCGSQPRSRTVGPWSRCKEDES